MRTNSDTAVAVGTQLTCPTCLSSPPILLSLYGIIPSKYDCTEQCTMLLCPVQAMNGQSITDGRGPITRRSFPREAFPREDAQGYVSARESQRAETYPCASSRGNASRGKDRRVIRWLKWPGQAGVAQGTEASMGAGIWIILCIKEHFFINSRGL